MNEYSWGLEDDNYLAHYGVRGMKWGVRRYQNKDGSYTREGLARFKKSADSYDTQRAKYKEAKASGNKSLAKQYKNNMKIAKGNMKRNYKQLKRDARADKGKELYKEGYRIRETKGLKRAAKITGGALTGAAFLHKMGINLGINVNVGKVGVSTTSAQTVALIGVAAAGASAASYAGEKFIYGPKNKNLRAYYGHSRRNDTPLNQINYN